MEGGGLAPGRTLQLLAQEQHATLAHLEFSKRARGGKSRKLCGGAGGASAPPARR